MRSVQRPIRADASIEQRLSLMFDRSLLGFTLQTTRVVVVVVISAFDSGKFVYNNNNTLKRIH